MWHSDNVYVIKTQDPLKLKTFLEAFGLTFQKEKHQIGPEHYACQVGDKVLEIYPKKTQDASLHNSLLDSILSLIRLEIKDLISQTSLKGWDEEEAEPISIHVWNRCLEFFQQNKELLPKLPSPPVFSPCGDGTVFISWTLPSLDEFLLEIGETSIQYQIRSTTGEFKSGNCQSLKEAALLLLQLS